MSGIHPRIAAISLLTRILEHKQTLDEALSQEESFRSLEGADRGFARAMVSASLRWLGLIDGLIAPFVTGRPFRELDPAVQQSLRIGVAQICVLETPVHAAVSETVEAVRYVEAARKAGGLVNAVLRKIEPEALAALDAPLSAIWPEAFAAQLKAAIGEDSSEALAAATTEIPPLDITCPKDTKFWSERLAGEQIAPNTVRLSEGIVEALPGYEAGNWWVQDVAATLPVHVLAPETGEQVLDLCAAPGGKTLQIAASGAKVTALDRAAKRMRRVEQNLKRTRLEAKCVVADARKWTTEDQFDAVLVDAPCSALGTLRRHPEGPWIKSPADLSRFPEIQSGLLETAAKFVKPGGRLVYCVCTPLPEEGVEIVDAFLAAHQGWSRRGLNEQASEVFANCLTEKGDFLTLPHLFAHPAGCDAFFIARLERNSD
ncbi:MAG: rRNA methyltransferase [Ponticaulis sp.]|nr:rRNA methyltransferase [Ponticaulis sp.]|tara:strand:+ start:14919 stop:16208 length:1290 start_codon:yes stop_codon:yes gene_type:complete